MKIIPKTGCILVLLIVMLIFSGCKAGVTDSNLNYNFKQGVSELNVNFYPNAPPKTVYPHSNFKFIFELNNQAAYDITEGAVKITGVDQRFFSIEPKGGQSFEYLLGRSLTAPDGDKIFVEFQGTAYEPLETSEEQGERFSVVILYKSNVEFTDTICINPNLYEVYDSGCKVEGIKTYSGQGAPLVISQMEEVISPGSNSEAEFRFLIKNRGQGEVGIVEVTKAKLGQEDLDCEFKQWKDVRKKIKFSAEEQEAILVCKKQFLKDLSSYTTTLSLNLNYEYKLEKLGGITLLR